MEEVHTGPIDELPDGAVPLLTVEHVMRAKGTIFCGKVACDEVRPGDRVAAVADRPLCKGVVGGLERFMELLDVAHRGDEVGLMVRGWADFPLAPGVRLYLIPKPRHAEPGAAADPAS